MDFSKVVIFFVHHQMNDTSIHENKRDKPSATSNTPQSTDDCFATQSTILEKSVGTLYYVNNGTNNVTPIYQCNTPAAAYQSVATLIDGEWGRKQKVQVVGDRDNLLHILFSEGYLVFQ